MINILLATLFLWFFSWCFVKIDDLVDNIIDFVKVKILKKKYPITRSLDIWEDLKNPPLREAYLKVYRFFLHIAEFPNDACREIKWAYQRVVRKWDDRVCWSIDYYLCEIMPSILKQYKKNLHGFPVAMVQDGDKLDKDGNTTEETDELCKKRWNDILDGLIKMFETARNVHDEHWFIQDSKTYNIKLANKYRKIQKELRDRKPELYSDTFGKVLTKKECQEYEAQWENFRKYFANLWD